MKQFLSIFVFVCLGSVLALASDPPQVHAVYIDAAYCQNIARIVGPSILPGSTLPCEQRVMVQAWMADLSIRAFSVTITYRDSAGSDRTQTAVVPANVTAGVVASTAFFSGVDNISNLSAIVAPLAEVSQSASVRVSQ